jgi:hypothetical protein
MNLIALKSNEEIYLNQPPFEKVGNIHVFRDAIQITLNDSLFDEEPPAKREKKIKKETRQMKEFLNTEPEITPAGER